MFGFLRFYLAWMVVITHISTVLDYVGGFAVYSFYILSGYLMTLIMNAKYGYSVTGINKYITNRFLRIFPPYWFVAAITLVAIWFAPAVFFGMHSTLRTPETGHEIAANLFIFGLFPGIPQGADMTMARLVPAAWALHVELCFYLLIGLFLGKYKSLVTLWVLISVAYHVLALRYGWPRYAPVYAASISFSLGSCLYHYRDELSRLVPHGGRVTLATLLLFLVFTLTAGLIPATTSVIPFYMNILFSFILLFQLSRVDSWKYPRLKKVDAFLGDLSYPIYLSHWLVAVAVAAWFGLEKSVTLFFVLIPFLLVFSTIMKYVVDDPIENRRRAISASLRKKKAAEQPATWRG